MTEADQNAAVTAGASMAANDNGPEGSLLNWLARSGMDDLVQGVRSGEITPQVAYQQAVQRQQAAANQ